MAALQAGSSSAAARRIWPTTEFEIDNFKITRSGTTSTFFEDSFDPGLLPTGTSTATYNVAFTEAVVGGRTVGVLTDESGNPQPGEFDPFRQNLITLQTNNSDDPANATQGLKKGHDFTVEARFNLAEPDDLRERYGIRLSDGDNDVIELVVRKAPNGAFRVDLRQRNPDTDQFELVDRRVLDLGGNGEITFNQITLRLVHAAGSDAVSVAYDLHGVNNLSGAAETRSFQLEDNAVGHLFSDETWTRAQIVATAPEFADTFLEGEYGTLSLDQTGRWEYNLRNGLPAVQALAEGEEVFDDFTVQVSDGNGGSDEQSITIQVTGTNDAPVTDVNGSAAGNDGTATFTGGGPAMVIGTEAAAITDVDSANLTSMTVTLTSRPDGDAAETLSLAASAAAAATAAGITATYTAATGVLSITGSATVATYETILRGVQYHNTDQAPDAASRIINVVVSDGKTESELNTSIVAIVRQAPSGTTFDTVISFVGGEGYGVESGESDGTYTGMTGAGTYDAAAVTSLDGVSLALGGTNDNPGHIILRFDDGTVLDGPGADLNVYDSFGLSEGFKIQTSLDGETWSQELHAGNTSGNSSLGATPLPFGVSYVTSVDLAALGVTSAKFVKITAADQVVFNYPQAYDLDAVEAVYFTTASSPPTSGSFVEGGVDVPLGTTSTVTGENDTSFFAGAGISSLDVIEPDVALSASAPAPVASQSAIDSASDAPTSGSIPIATVGGEENDTFLFAATVEPRAAIPAADVTDDDSAAAGGADKLDMAVSTPAGSDAISLEHTGNNANASQPDQQLLAEGTFESDTLVFAAVEPATATLAPDAIDDYGAVEAGANEFDTAAINTVGSDAPLEQASNDNTQNVDPVKNPGSGDPYLVA